MSYLVKINGPRLWDSLMQMAKIGATAKGGCNRQALTDLDKQARDLWVQWAEEAGCDLRIIKWVISLPVDLVLITHYRRW